MKKLLKTFGLLALSASLGSCALFTPAFEGYYDSVAVNFEIDDIETLFSLSLKALIDKDAEFNLVVTNHKEEDAKLTIKNFTLTQDSSGDKFKADLTNYSIDLKPGTPSTMQIEVDDLPTNILADKYTANFYYQGKSVRIHMYSEPSESK